jgi:hypothetical protein
LNDKTNIYIAKHRNAENQLRVFKSALHKIMHENAKNKTKQMLTLPNILSRELDRKIKIFECGNASARDEITKRKASK